MWSLSVGIVYILLYIIFMIFLKIAPLKLATFQHLKNVFFFFFEKNRNFQKSKKKVLVTLARNL